jgi:MerR family transcriptional regulator, light-induced transcriptional regulator
MVTFINKSPIYNLKTALEKTGIKADALRAWERRYGLPSPARSDGRQRLYSLYDIEVIKWLLARQSKGVRISQAVEEWNDLCRNGGDPFQKSELPPPPGTSSPVSIPLNELKTEWLQAGVNFDESRMEDILKQAFAILPVEAVCTEIIQNGLNEIGEKWYRGEISTQQEHFISAFSMRRIEALIVACPRPFRHQKVLIGCAPTDWHTLPLLILNLFLRRKGIKVIYLGANVAFAQLVEAVQFLAPHLVVLSAQQLSTAAFLYQTADSLTRRGFQTAYGGWIFNHLPALQQVIPAHYLGADINSAIQKIETLCIQPFSRPAVETIPPAVLQTASLFASKRSQIELEVLESISHFGIKPKSIELANHFFGNDLAAGLELGNIDFMDIDLQWATRMASSKPFYKYLEEYLKIYALAVNQTMGSEGQLITDWIEAYLKFNHHPPAE